MTMMGFITLCFKNGRLDRAARWLRVCSILVCASIAQAQGVGNGPSLAVERIEDDILVSSQVQFDLPPAVEDALQKGLPLYFVLEADILRERWYWYDKKVSSAERHIRIAYQPLTRRWKLTVTSGAPKSGSLGLSLNQNFDTLAQALAVIKRVLRWKIADVSGLDSALNYKVQFRFWLDLSQLPLPFQIGAIGQSDWNVAVTQSAPIPTELLK
ncbi:MAG: hypothetical protein RLZZ573_1407 [Pseudomonadota bacterium]|jgi:hypothetical protein